MILRCEKCGRRKNVVMHHDDYSKPHEVRLLCRSHHTNLHLDLANAGSTISGTRAEKRAAWAAAEALRRATRRSRATTLREVSAGLTP